LGQVGRQVSISKDDDVLLVAVVALGGLPHPEFDGAPFLGILRVLDVCKGGVLLINGPLQEVDPAVRDAVGLDPLLRQLARALGTSIIDVHDLPAAGGSGLKQPLHLPGLVDQEVLAVRVLLLGAHAVLLVVQRHQHGHKHRRAGCQQRLAGRQLRGQVHHGGQLPLLGQERVLHGPQPVHRHEGLQQLVGGVVHAVPCRGICQVQCQRLVGDRANDGVKLFRAEG